MERRGHARPVRRHVDSALIRADGLVGAPDRPSERAAALDESLQAASVPVEEPLHVGEFVGAVAVAYDERRTADQALELLLAFGHQRNEPLPST